MKSRVESGSKRKLSTDTMNVFAGSEEGCVRLWSSTGQEIATLEGHGARVLALAWSADGTLASGHFSFFGK